MDGKDHRAILWTFDQFFHEHRTLIAQPVNDEFIVNDFMAHEDRSALFFQSHLYDLDRPIHACAKPAGCGKVER